MQISAPRGVRAWRGLAAAVLGGLLVAACGGGGDGGGGGVPLIAAVTPTAPGTATPPPASPGASRTVTDSVASRNVGVTYGLSIYLPPSYDTSDKRFPVIYALDGDATFPPAGRFENLKAILERRGVQAILVGIGRTDRRAIDFTAPGYVAYHAFLTGELVPYVESKYRADASMRILTGLSLGGSMTGHALFMEGATGTLTFTHFLSFEGSYQQSGTDELLGKMYDTLKDKALPATLILARCADLAKCNYHAVGQVYEALEARHYAGFTLVLNTYETTHAGTDLPAFEDSIAMIFK